MPAQIIDTDPTNNELQATLKNIRKDNPTIGHAEFCGQVRTRLHEEFNLDFGEKRVQDMLNKQRRDRLPADPQASQFWGLDRGYFRVYGNGSFDYYVYPQSDAFHDLISGFHYLEVASNETELEFIHSELVQLVWTFFKLAGKIAGIGEDDLAYQFQVEWGFNPKLDEESHAQKTAESMSRYAKDYKTRYLLNSTTNIYDEKVHGAWVLSVLQVSSWGSDGIVGIQTFVNP